MAIRERGFTIIELIVVIALLGILSAVALPRFINVTTEAHDASVEGAGAGFATGIALLKAQAVADGTVGAGGGVNFDGSDMLVNTSGFAIGVSTSGLSVTPGGNVNCTEVWAGVLQGNAPSVAQASGNGVDYVTTNGGSVCVYDYVGAVDKTRQITYTASTGDVSVTIN